MKIVIDIDEVIYEMILNTGTFGKYRFNTARAIQNGIPIPKNHGRLIDVDELSKGLMKRWNTADNNAEKQISQVIANVVIPIVVSTPTIIEKESGKGDTNEDTSSM